MKYRFGLKYFSEDDKTTSWKKYKKIIQNSCWKWDSIPLGL